MTGHLLQSGDDIRTVQELLGQPGVNTTMISTHVLTRDGRGVRRHVDAPAHSKQWSVVMGLYRPSGRPLPP